MKDQCLVPIRSPQTLFLQLACSRETNLFEQYIFLLIQKYLALLTLSFLLFILSLLFSQFSNKYITISESTIKNSVFLFEIMHDYKRSDLISKRFGNWVEHNFYSKSLFPSHSLFHSYIPMLPLLLLIKSNLEKMIVSLIIHMSCCILQAIKIIMFSIVLYLIDDYLRFSDTFAVTYRT